MRNPQAPAVGRLLAKGLVEERHLQLAVLEDAFLDLGGALLLELGDVCLPEQLAGGRGVGLGQRHLGDIAASQLGHCLRAGLDGGSQPLQRLGRAAGVGPCSGRFRVIDRSRSRPGPILFRRAQTSGKCCCVFRKLAA